MRSMALRAVFVLAASAAIHLTSFSASALAGPSDDTLRVLITRETDFIDPIHTNSTETDLFGVLVYDTLIHADRATGEHKPSLAAKWTWVDDRTIDFELREGVTFHNGEPLDSADVVYTFKMLMDKNNKFRQQENDFGNIASAEATGDYSVRVTLREPDPTFENMLASRIVIWPNEYTSEHGHMIHATKPVGTGPYALESLQQGSEYVLKKNENYFAGPRPAPTIGHIQVRVIPEVQTQIAELMAGAADMVLFMSAADAAALQGFPGVKVATGPATRMFFLSMNAAGGSEDNPLRNVDVRRAISYAINRQEIATNLISPDAPVLHSHCNPTQAFCITDGVPGYEFNPEKARALLQEAGYTDGVQLAMMAEVSLRPVAEPIQGYLANVGITMSLDTYPLPAWREKYIGGESQMSIVGWGGGATAADASYSLGIFFNQSSTDYAKDPQVTEWNEQAIHSMDPAKREELYRQSFSRINEQAYTLPLYGSVATYISAETVEFEPPFMDFPDLSLAGWAGN